MCKESSSTSGILMPGIYDRTGRTSPATWIIWIYLNSHQSPSHSFAKTNPCVIPNSLEDLGRCLYRNPPELCLLCVPEPSGTSSAIAGTLPAICAAALRNLIGHLHQNPPEPHQPSAPEPAGTLFAMCTGTLRHLISHRRNRIRNLISYLHRNPPEPCLLSAPSSAICAGTVRNLISFLHRNPLEPHQLSAPEASGTFRNPPELSPEPRVAAAPDRTKAILG